MKNDLHKTSVKLFNFADLEVRIATHLPEEGWTDNPEVEDNILSCLKRCAFTVGFFKSTDITESVKKM